MEKNQAYADAGTGGPALRDFIADGDLGGLAWIMGLFVVLAVVAWLAEFVRQWAMAKVGHRILLTMRRQVFDHMMSLSQGFYDDAEVGRVMSRVTSDVQVLQELLTTGVLTVVSDVLGLMIVIALLLVIDVQLAMVTFVVLPFLLVAMIWWSKRARVAFLEVRSAIAAVNGTLNEDLNGVRVVQSVGRQDENAKRFDDVNGWNLRATRRAGLMSAAVIPGPDLRLANFTRAEMSGTDLSGASLEGNVFAHANLEGARLRGAQLRRADFSDARLKNADLTRAQLNGSILRDADLRGATLTAADFSGADLADARFEDAVVGRIDWFDWLAGLATPPVRIVGCAFLPSSYNIMYV